MEPPVLELSNIPIEYAGTSGEKEQPPLLELYEPGIDPVLHATVRDMTGVKDEHSNSNRAPIKKTFSCSHAGCTKSYTRRHRLKVHVAGHHSIPNNLVVWRCYYCELVFSSQGTYQKHVLTCHLTLSMKEMNIQSKEHGHDKPLKQHKQLESLPNQHQSGPSQHRCEMICYKVFNTQQALRRHWLHAHQCKATECDEGLKKAKKPKEVIETPKPKLQYRCTVLGCNRAFSLQSKLKAHVNNHQEYECGVCLKTFICKSYLKNHLYTHTTKRPVFICGHESCKQKYKSLNGLKHHVNLHHFNKQLLSGLDLSRHKHTRKKMSRKQKLPTKTMTKINREIPNKGHNSVANLNFPKQELPQLDKQQSVGVKSSVPSGELMGKFSKCPNATTATILMETQAKEDGSPQAIDTEESESLSRPTDTEYRETD